MIHQSVLKVIKEDDLPTKISEYVRRNHPLFKLFHDCEGYCGFRYEEIYKCLEDEGEVTAGLGIRLQAALDLGLIGHDGIQISTDRTYFLTGKGLDCYLEYINQKNRMIEKERDRRKINRKNRLDKKLRYVA